MNRTHVDAPPSRVWAVLADPTAYRHWVVGSVDVRAVDPGFPLAVGSRFHHAVGIGPLRLPDHTEVLEATEPGHLRLEAKGRPLGRAIVDLRVVPEGAGSRVEIREEPSSPVSRATHNPLADALVKLRNVESLRRLSALAEGRAEVPATTLRPEAHRAGDQVPRGG